MVASQGKRLASAAIIVMSSIVLSRITGFLREMLISVKIGVNELSDAYFAGFLIPDLMYNLLVGGAISAALIPVISGYLERDEEEEGWKAASTFINIIFGAMIFICILGEIFAPYILPLLNPGLINRGADIQLLAIKITRILFPSVAFIMLAGICTGVLNSYKKFAAAAYGPSIYNIGCALSIFIFGKKDPKSIELVAIGVACSAAVYFLFQFFSTYKYLKNYRFTFLFKHHGFRKLFRQAVPSILSSSIVQLNVIISASFVTLFAAGSLAAFRNANTTWQLPYGIFAMGIGTAMLPTLSGRLAVGAVEEYRDILMKAMKSVLFLSAPSAVGFIILREPLIRAIFKWGGKFGEKDVQMVAGILMIFSIAMITQSIVATMNRAFYAANDTKTPLLIGAFTILLNYGFGYVFYRFTNLGAAGMALSYSIISTINSVLLLLLLNKKMGGIHLDKLLVFLAKALPASVAMGAVLYVLNILPIQLSSKPIQLIYLLFEVTAGAIVYFAVMLLMKAEEAVYFMRVVKVRFKNILNKIA